MLDRIVRGIFFVQPIFWGFVKCNCSSWYLTPRMSPVSQLLCVALWRMHLDDEWDRPSDGVSSLGTYTQTQEGSSGLDEWGIRFSMAMCHVFLLWESAKVRRAWLRIKIVSSLAHGLASIIDQFGKLQGKSFSWCHILLTRSYLTAWDTTCPGSYQAADVIWHDLLFCLQA